MTPNKNLPLPSFLSYQAFYKRKFRERAERIAEQEFLQLKKEKEREV